jgi:hypothetical protein
MGPIYIADRRVTRGMLLFRAVLLFNFLAFQSVKGSSCPQGSYYNGDPGKLECISCPPGTYQPLPDTSYCLECKQGTYSTGVGMKSPWDCRNCPSGTYAVNTSWCNACPPFTTSPQGAFRVTECRAKPGYYAEIGQKGFPCPEKTFCPSGATVPNRCPYGTTSTSMSTECHLIWKDLRLYNLVFGCMWVFLFFVSMGWATWRSNSYSHHEARGEIQIKIAP